MGFPSSRSLLIALRRPRRFTAVHPHQKSLRQRFPSPHTMGSLGYPMSRLQDRDVGMTVRRSPAPTDSTGPQEALGRAFGGLHGGFSAALPATGPPASVHAD